MLYFYSKCSTTKLRFKTVLWMMLESQDQVSETKTVKLKITFSGKKKNSFTAEIKYRCVCFFNTSFSD